jgi:hypothetical protein
MQPDFYNELRARYPWLDQIGIDPNFVRDQVAEASGPDELLVRLRQSPAYKARFPGLWRSDGSLRMDERQYLAREQDFRSLLRQYGYNLENYSTPASLVGFFDSEMDPNEFQTRLQTYADIQKSSRAKKDAFYVYAGLSITDDDLYEATVNPAAAQRLSDEYNRAVAAQQFDYETFITRATEVGNQRVADLLTGMQRTGAVTGAAVQKLIGTDPAFARQVMDVLYTGGGPRPTATLSLEDLLASFEYAAIGAAAKESGLELPTKERIAEIRQAGIERQQAIQAYQQFGAQRGSISASVMRAGGQEFGQDSFERAQFLGQEDPARDLRRGLEYQDAAGQGSGSFRFTERQDRIQQSGFGVR